MQRQSTANMGIKIEQSWKNANTAVIKRLTLEGLRLWHAASTPIQCEAFLVKSSTHDIESKTETLVRFTLNELR